MVVRRIGAKSVIAKRYRSESVEQAELSAKYGNLFNPDTGFQVEPDVEFNVDGVDHRKCIFNQKVVTYLICSCKPDSENYYLPFPYPFLAVTQNDGKTLRSYYAPLDFERALIMQKEKGFYWTGYQLDLNELCYEMFQQVKEIDQLKGDERVTAYKQRMTGFISLWAEAIDALDHERYVRWYDLPDLSHWSRLPAMKNTDTCDLYHNVVRITFLLKEYADCYSLKMIIRANEKIISLNDAKRTFFLTEGNKFYLVTYALEEQLLNWMVKSKGKLTVLKHDFQSFHENYLSQICRAYHVDYLPLLSKKAMPYTFEAITLASPLNP